MDGDKRQLGEIHLRVRKALAGVLKSNLFCASIAQMKEQLTTATTDVEAAISL